MPDTAERWQYRHTWMRDQPEHRDEDRDLIHQHLDEWSAGGWELVSANAVQHLLIRTDDNPAGPLFPGHVSSSSVMRHYFYWRKRVSD